jgi:hypothetical protein
MVLRGPSERGLAMNIWLHVDPPRAGSHSISELINGLCKERDSPACYE